jgi:predicted molibdopterin-dependent oxidoreductase YjgC
LRGEIKGLLIFGEDPLLEKSNRKYLNGVEFLVASSSFFGNITDEADVVLPLPTYIEQEGTYTRCDNTIQKANKIIDNINCFYNWEIIRNLASQFSDGFKYETLEAINNEIKAVNRFYKYTSIGKSWLKGFFTYEFNKKELTFAIYDIDFTSLDPIKTNIHYQENYYFSNIKKLLV